MHKICNRIQFIPTNFKPKNGVSHSHSTKNSRKHNWQKIQKKCQTHQNDYNS